VALTSDRVVHNLAYGTSKGALDRIVIAAAGELGARGYTANLVNPGPVDTGWTRDEVRWSLLARQSTGRLGTPADIAALVSFLISDAGTWTTGQLITTDGGFSIA
jgi:3-oxoacyl-[acyl-carrier protein] reductase